ncbi:MAG TPA: hypothetical protein VKI19_03005 [Acidimicrobiales bacterium]|nr:hypothetical protein [Acidimicrobiales bacterium]
MPVPIDTDIEMVATAYLRSGGGMLHPPPGPAREPTAAFTAEPDPAPRPAPVQDQS